MLTIGFVFIALAVITGYVVAPQMAAGTPQRATADVAVYVLNGIGLILLLLYLLKWLAIPLLLLFLFYLHKK